MIGGRNCWLRYLDNRRYIFEENKRRVRKKTASEIESEKLGQLSLFDTSNTNIKMDDIILELHDINLSDTTPIEALNILYKMQEKLKERM